MAITFLRTGHFWNDLGIIALWRWLAETAQQVTKITGNGYVAKQDGVHCTLQADRLELSGPKDAALKLLTKAADMLRSYVWQPTCKGKMWWSGPAAFLYAGQNKPEFIAAYDELPSKSKWRRSGRCDVCGRDDLPVRTTGTSYNPLLVAVDRMSTFYSELRGGYRICQSCAFAAPFGLTRAWFSIQGNSLSLLWPVGQDFLTLDRFYRTTSHHFTTEQPFRNYKQVIPYANTPLACFLDLLCSLWRVTKTETDKNALEMALFGVQFHAMQLSKARNVVTVDRYEIIPDPAGVLQLVRACDRTSKQGQVWNALNNTLAGMPIVRRQPNGKTRADTRLLDALAKAIIVRASAEEALEARVYEALAELRDDPAVAARFPLAAFRAFILTYFKEVKDMTAELLPALQSVGETLGELVKVTDDRRILYSLRNARTPDDLLEVLSRVVVRHADAFIEGKPKLYRKSVRELAESIDQSNWRQVRSLLGIYAGLKFIELSRPAGGSTPTPNKP
jgi:hypothetical protein